MTEQNYANLAYLGLLAAALIFWMFVQNRDGAGRKLQYLMVWGLIFVGVIAAVGLWGDIRREVVPRQQVFAGQNRIELPRAPDGHYYARLGINGAEVDFVVDTGATGMVLSQSDAARAGIDTADLIFRGSANTANGTVRTAPVRLDEVTLGPFRDSGVLAHVNGGEMRGSLLGMSYLQRFERLEISDGRMILER